MKFNQRYYFLSWSLSYLTTSSELIKKTLKDKRKPLIAPALYCFRHSYELFLKGFDINSLTKPDSVFMKHTLDNLGAPITHGKFGKKALKALAKKIGDVTTEDEINFVLKIMQKDLISIGKKMQKYSYIGKDGQSDMKNTAFRYPTPQITQQIEKMSWKNIKDIEKDINNFLQIQSTFSGLLFGLLRDKDGNDIKLDLLVDEGMIKEIIESRNSHGKKKLIKFNLRNFCSRFKIFNLFGQLTKD